jgi:hypothetical protein
MSHRLAVSLLFVVAVVCMGIVLWGNARRAALLEPVEE